MKKRINLKSVLAISFLAVAGLFGVASVVLNKQAEETPVVEKADAADDTSTWKIIGTIGGKTYTKTSPYASEATVSSNKISAKLNYNDSIKLYYSDSVIVDGTVLSILVNKINTENSNIYFSNDSESIVQRPGTYTFELPSNYAEYGEKKYGLTVYWGLYEESTIYWNDTGSWGAMSPYAWYWIGSAKSESRVPMNRPASGNFPVSATFPAGTSHFQFLHSNGSTDWGKSEIAYLSMGGTGPYNMYQTSSHDNFGSGWKINSKSYKADGGFSTEKGLYVTLPTNWGTFSDYKFAVYWCEPTSGTDITWTWLTCVPGETSLYETTVPQGGGYNKTWTKVIVARQNKSAATQSWENKPGGGASTVDQTIDIVLTSLSSGYQHIMLWDNGDWGNKTCSLSDNYTDTNRAESWGSRFKSVYTDGTCDRYGINTNLTTLAANWVSAKSEYQACSKAAQGIIWSTTADESTSATQLKQALARYDYIVFTKQYVLITDLKTTDFIGRNNKGSGAGSKIGTLGTVHHFSPLSLLGDSEDNLSTIIIIAASSVALLSVTALSILVIKKRKHKEE